MSTLLDQLLQDHGDEIARKISDSLGISEDEAAGVLPAAAPVLMDRFQPSSSEEEGGVLHDSLDGLLDGAGEQLNDRIRDQLGVSPEQAAKVVPLLVPVVLRFLMRRLPYGSAAVPLVTSLVEKQGYGSLDEIASRLAKRITPESTDPDEPLPSIPTMLGRWAGKWFPSGDD